MTNKEIQGLLKQVDSKDWFKNVEAKFKYNQLELEVEKRGFLDIYTYVKRQVRAWDKIEVNLHNYLQQSKNQFSIIQSRLEVFLKNGLKQNDSTLQSNWNNITQTVNELNRSNFFPADHPKTLFLIELSQESTSRFNGAYKYWFGNSTLSFGNSEEFVGAMMAYEFQFEDITKISNRRSKEKSSNALIRNAFERKFTETQQKVNDFFSSSDEEFTKKMNLIAQKTREQQNHVNELVEKKTEEYETWVEQCKINDQEYTKQHLDRVKDLELLYREKLKLEAPADYWRKRAEKLNKEGRNWLIGLVVVTALAIISLGTVLYFISDGTLKDLFDKTGSAIRWSVVFITFVSFLAYAIRMFAKLMLSSYHLSRDAEEREQLAYVYLSLKDNQSIDDTERHLIMQSLFSRADSGLLKDDASPTMPGGSVIEKIMGGK